MEKDFDLSRTEHREENDIFDFEYDNLGGTVDTGVLGDERFSYGAVSATTAHGALEEEEALPFGLIEDPTLLLERAKERNVVRKRPSGEKDNSPDSLDFGEGLTEDTNQEPTPEEAQIDTAPAAPAPEEEKESKPLPKTPQEEGPKESITEGKGAKGEESTAGVDAGPIEANIDDSSSEGFIRSLAAGTPSNLMAGMGRAPEVVPKIQAQEKEELKNSLPEIEQPTGLETKEQKQKKREQPETGQVPEFKTETKDQPQVKLEEKHEQPGPKPPVDKVKPPSIAPKAQGEGTGNEAWLQKAKASMKQSIKRLPSKDHSLKTGTGSRPQVDTTGSADPQQNQENQSTSDTTMGEEKAKADQATKQDFGEQDIFPDVETEMLSPQVEPKNPAPPSLKEVSLPEKIPAHVLSTFDKEAKAKMDREMAPHLKKQEAALAKKKADDKKERNQTDKEIAQQTQQARTAQEAEQKKAQDDVTQHRTEWRTENQKIRDQYDQGVQKERAKVDGDIHKKIDETDKKVDAALSKAEKEAATEKRRVEAEAAKKKKEAERKADDKNWWWNQVKEAVSNFFNTLKKTLNALFDALRSFVKRIIEAAKKLASTLIDAARDFIIAAIKAFGEVLKALVSVALAAFPRLAKRINGLIDRAVETACDAVNQIAEGLKTVVCALLDALGAVLDAILAAYQAVYNAILSAIAFLVEGLMRILEGLANICLSLLHTLGTLKGDIVKEFIGEDVFSPLPNVESSNKELPILEQMKAQVMDTTTMGPLTETEHNQQNSLASKTVLDDGDFILEPPRPIEINPDLAEQLRETMGDATSYELGGADHPVETSDLHKHVLGAGTPLPATEKENAGSTDTDADNGLDPETKKWLSKTDEEKLQGHLMQMGKEPENPEAKKDGQKEDPEPVQDPASPTEIAMKTGRLSVGRRLKFVGAQMVKGMQLWWAKNKKYVYAGLIGILVLGGVVAFFTGGAGLIGLLQLAIKALTVWFVADVVLKIKSHLWEWLSKAWNGYPKEGAKSLSKALAIAFSEFWLDYILRGAGKAFKQVKKSIKATKGFQKISRGAAKVRQGAVNTVKHVTKPIRSAISKGSKYAMKPMRGVVAKGGKYVMKIKKGFGRGIKKLSDLRYKILDRLGFKRIWVERAGIKLRLWGEFNAKVLLSETDAEGNNKTRNLSPADRKYLRKTYGNKSKVGRKMEDGGIGITDEFARQIDAGKAKFTHAELEKMDTDEIRKKMGITGIKPTKKAGLRKGKAAKKKKYDEPGKKEGTKGKEKEHLEAPTTNPEYPNLQKDYPEIHEVIKDLDPEVQQRFLSDFSGNSKEALEVLRKNPSLVDSWKVLDDAGVDDVLRKNVDNLTGTKNYLDNNPSRVDEFKSHLSTEASKGRDGLYLKSLLERKEFKGTVYRGDKASKTPAEVFENGFSSPGTHDNLLNHIESNTTRGDFVSTTKDASIADQFASKNGYVYEIRSQKGVDVNSTLGDDADAFFPEQVEVSMPGGVLPSDIKGAYPKGKVSPENFIPNPNYVE